MSGFIWDPSPDVVDGTNVMRLARKHGLTSYEQLRERSVSDTSWFWDAVVEDLGIGFDTPYSRVVDTSRGVQWPMWFVGGRVNIAKACLARHQGLAVIAESEDGSVTERTYADLEADVGRLAAGLRSLGVRKGDAVGVFLPMTADAVIALLACCALGAIVIPIFSGFGPPAIASRLADADAKVLICQDAFTRRGGIVAMKQTADEAVAASPSVRHVVVARRSSGDVPWRSGRDVWWDDLVRAHDDAPSYEDTEAEDPFMIAYTSGTTGRPKGTVHVHGGFLVKIAAEAAYQTDLQPGERLWWLADPGWIMGPWAIVGTLGLGGTVVCYDGAPDHPGPERLWSMIERHRVNIFGVSPTLVRALMRHGPEPVERHDLSTLRILGSTGEPWNPEPYRWFSRHVGGDRCPIINFSGGTEVGACFLSPTPAMPLKACSLGGPALGLAVDVWDAEGEPVRGGVGELVCTKPWPGMTRGVWGDPDRYIEAYWSRWPDVWVHGDWASIDEDGQWFLHGRSDDTLNVAGKRLGPAEVESVLVAHPDVAEAAVVGVPDEVKGEAVWCYCIPAPGSDVSEGLRDELSSLVASELGKAFRPAAVLFVDDLPRTRSAKIMRRAVRAIAMGVEAGDLSSIEDPGALDAVRSAR